MSFSARVLLSLMACQQCLGAKTMERMARNGKATNIDAAGRASVVQQPSFTSESAVDLLERVENMAADGNADPESIKVIKDLVENQLLPALTEQHSIANGQVANRLKAIADCETKSTQMDTGVENATASGVNDARVAHATCRKSELAQKSDKTAKCAFLEYLTEPAALPRESADEKSKIAYGRTMMDYWCNKGEVMDHCSAAVDELAATKKSCDHEQSQFESQFCAMAMLYHAQCQELNDVCYTQSRKAYDDFKAATEKLITKWKIEYAALKKISCFVDVWLQDNDVSTVNADKFEACKNTDADTTVMDIDFGTPVQEFVCKDAGFGTLPDYPGTPDFTTKEYSEFPGLAQDVLVCNVPDPVAVTHVKA